MILVSFFSEDNVLSEEIKICCIFEYHSNKNRAFRFSGTPGIYIHDYHTFHIIPIHYSARFFRLRSIWRMQVVPMNCICLKHLSCTMDVQRMDSGSTPPLLWSNDSHRHLNMCILMRTFRWWTICRLYNHVLSLTKEQFPLLRFILADVPFQNMSLNE